MLINLYAQRPATMIAEIVLTPVIWMALMIVTAKKQRCGRLLNGLLLLTGMYLILTLTLFSRKPAVQLHEMSFPLQLIRVALFKKREVFRSILLNILLFEPFGASFANLLPERITVRNRILLTVIFGLLLSVSVETCQYIFSLGIAEADDVICNTLGALIGALSLPLSVYLTGKMRPYS